MAFDMEKLQQSQAIAAAARQRSGKMLAEANAVPAECERQRLANADSQVKALLDDKRLKS
jgi:hypothetical protein